MEKEYTGCVDKNGYMIFFGNRLLITPLKENPDYDRLIKNGKSFYGRAKKIDNFNGFVVKAEHGTLLFENDSEPCYEVELMV